MQHYKARQVLDGPDAGKWRYTVAYDKAIYAVGACAECPGHATEEEAREHFKSGRLKEMTLMAKATEWPKHKCEVPECTNEGVLLVNIPGSVGGAWEVCGDHASVADIANLYRVGECWSS